MTFQCKKDSEELLEVYIKGLEGRGKNVLVPTIFMYCEKCQTFYKLRPEEHQGDVEVVE